MPLTTYRASITSGDRVNNVKKPDRAYVSPLSLLLLRSTASTLRTPCLSFPPSATVWVPSYARGDGINFLTAR